MPSFLGTTVVICFISAFLFWYLQITFQAEEPPGGRKQYNMRGRDRQHGRVRVSDSSNGQVSCEDDDDDFQPQLLRKKKATVNKDNTKSFYGDEDISLYNGN